MSDEAIEIVAPSLARKLSEIMGDVHRIPKRGRNDFHKYDYVMEADLTEAVREKLSAKGICLNITVMEHTRHVNTDKEGNPSGFFDYVTLKFVLTDSESKQSVISTMIGCGYDKGDKGVYKAITGATKYWIYKTFLIPTGDDPESDSKTDKAMAETDQKQVLERKLKDIEEQKKETSGAPKKGCISQPQQKRMWAIAKTSGWQNEEIKLFLKSKYGIEHTADIPKDKYEEICADLEGGTQPNEEEAIPF